MAGQRYNYILSHEGEGGSEAAASVPKPVSAEKNAKKEKKKTKEPGLRFYDGNLDMVFFAVVIVLLVYGIIMMFSASYIAGLSSPAHDGYMYVRTQGIAAVAGVVMMVIISFFDYHILMNSKLVLIGFLGGLGLLTYTSFFGSAVAKARRWISIGGSPEGGGLSIQPSELMKPIMIIFLAFLLSKVQSAGFGKKDIWRYVFVFSAICLNMVLQRHMSGLLLMVVIGFMVLFIGGMPIKEIVRLGVILGVLGIVGIAVISALGIVDLSYVLDRFTSMSTADSGEMTAENWQTAQSLIAIGSGGWFGLGFGESKQKYNWLPESQNDFIISVIVEELGYLGGLVVIILFGLLIYRGFYIAKKAPDKFGMLITAGITFHIGIQALLNIGVACNAFPNTGISLPFFSSGGTALLIQLAEMGVVLAVSRQCEI